MPQFDFSNPLTISQVVWMLLIFGGLYMLLSGWALPRVAAVVEGRTARIESDLETARAAKAEADSAVTEITAATRQAQSEAQAEIARAVAQAKAEAAEQARQANERLDAQLAEAERRIADARAAAMGALRQVASEATATVVTRLTGQPADPRTVVEAVGDVMTARG